MTEPVDSTKKLFDLCNEWMLLKEHYCYEAIKIMKAECKTYGDLEKRVSELRSAIWQDDEMKEAIFADDISPIPLIDAIHYLIKKEKDNLEIVNYPETTGIS